MAKNAFLTLVVSIFQKSTLENSGVGIFRFNFFEILMEWQWLKVYSQSLKFWGFKG